MTKLISICLLIVLLFTSCTSTNEDPTNIELEVLRVSLLEKELIIDELHQSLDENNRQNNTLIARVEDLETQLESELRIKEKLLEGQSQIMTIHENKPHFYDVINDSLYIVTVYDDEEFAYSYEELLRYDKDQVGQTVYKGEEIEYKVDEKTNITSVLDIEKFRIIDNDLEVRYSYDIDLNDPLIELSSSLYANELDKQMSYVLLWKYIDEDVSTLYSIISFDYHNLSDIVATQLNLVTKDYEISEEFNTLIYVEVTQEADTLISLDLETGDKQILLLNETEPYSMYKNDGNIYYFDEENDGFLRYDNN